MAILETVPRRGTEGVDPAVTLDLCWSTYLDPRSLDVGAAAVSSGAARFDSALTLQLFAWRGPGGGQASRDIPWCPGSVVSVTPKAPLIEGVHFRLTMAASARGWHGEEIDFETEGWYRTEAGDPFYTLEFTVAERMSNASPPAPGDLDPPSPLTLADLFSVGRVFDPARNLCSCHRDADHPAQALLNLSTPEMAAVDLLGSARLRDTGFPMVSPRNPSESFLIHKLLRDEDGSAIYGVLGEAMPPQAPLPYADAVDLARWIEAGAL